MERLGRLVGEWMNGHFKLSRFRKNFRSKNRLQDTASKKLSVWTLSSNIILQIIIKISVGISGKPAKKAPSRAVRAIPVSKLLEIGVESDVHWEVCWEISGE